uniref:uncharacterized protein LOC122609507 n=1 Tax=Erigeron canadensis TaxID=72917 RepID=UPI001CB91832|nr:uncharacterized protein LOC122609507 [Erigeron canadensis]
MGWIATCLNSARSSVLVNGSLTMEFPLGRGLRQGDPLAPFLFIIAMEGFHVAMEDAKAAGKFKAVSIGDTVFSHLIYADDVMVIGEWSQANFINIIDIFNCFYLASGLQINVVKSKLYGTSVSDNEISRIASLAGCKWEKIPFLYLGTPIGANMNRYVSWQPVGDDEAAKNIYWIKWELVIAGKEKGGLGFGSLRSFNQALLYKWIWRFHNHPNMLWAKIIKNLYPHDSCDRAMMSLKKRPGTWSKIVELARELNDGGYVPFSAIKKKIGNGMSTKIWNDIWINESTLAQQFPRLYALEIDKNVLVGER